MTDEKASAAVVNIRLEIVGKYFESIFKKSKLVLNYLTVHYAF